MQVIKQAAIRPDIGIPIPAVRVMYIDIRTRIDENIFPIGELTHGFDIIYYLALYIYKNLVAMILNFGVGHPIARGHK